MDSSGSVLMRLRAFCCCFLTTEGVGKLITLIEIFRDDLITIFNCLFVVCGFALYFVEGRGYIGTWKYGVRMV